MGSAASSPSSANQAGGVSCVGGAAHLSKVTTFTPPDLSSGLDSQNLAAGGIAASVRLHGTRRRVRFFRRRRPRRNAKPAAGKPIVHSPQTESEASQHDEQREQNNDNNDNTRIPTNGTAATNKHPKGIAWKITSATQSPAHGTSTWDINACIVDASSLVNIPRGTRRQVVSTKAVCDSEQARHHGNHHQHQRAHPRGAKGRRASSILTTKRSTATVTLHGNNNNNNHDRPLIRQLKSSRSTGEPRQRREDTRCETDSDIKCQTIATCPTTLAHSNNQRSTKNNNNNATDSLESDSWRLLTVDSPRGIHVDTCEEFEEKCTTTTTATFAGTTMMPNVEALRTTRDRNSAIAADNSHRHQELTCNDSRVPVEQGRHMSGAHAGISDVFGPTTTVVMVTPSTAGSNRPPHQHQPQPQSQQRPIPPQAAAKRWRKGDLIGAGSFGHVFQALDQDSGALIAVKEVRTANAREVELVQREIEIMSSLEHPNVVRFLGSQTDSASGTVFVITEWVPGGSISSLVQRFGALTERTVRSYGRQLIAVLAYLHARNVVHRDVKVGNWYSPGCVE
jgi:hypothetical protein